MTTTTEAARALAAMRKTFGGRRRVMGICAKCGKVLTARERRKPCPEHKL